LVVFLPTDPPNVWLLAKMHLSCSEVSIHQGMYHLCYTHLAMEGFVMCTKRYLSIYHPIHRLLYRHFFYLLAINATGFGKLVSPGGWFDRATSIGVEGCFELIRRAYKKWNFSESSPEADLKRRGMMDLEYYPYRDDALLLWSMIQKFVDEIVKFYYKTDDDVVNDFELQDWARALVQESTVPGFPGNGKLTDRHQVCFVVALIIFTCSVGHASVNFPTYEYYGFIPNQPGALRKPAPNTKTDVTEEELCDHLPDSSTALDQIAVTCILSEKGTASIGDYAQAMFFEPETKQAVSNFRAEIKHVSEVVAKRNEKRKTPYRFLDPVNIPNSIAI